MYIACCLLPIACCLSHTTCQWCTDTISDTLLHTHTGGRPRPPLHTWAARRRWGSKRVSNMCTSNEQWEIGNGHIGVSSLDDRLICVISRSASFCVLSHRCNSFHVFCMVFNSFPSVARLCHLPRACFGLYCNHKVQIHPAAWSGGHTGKWCANIYIYIYTYNNTQIDMYVLNRANKQ